MISRDEVIELAKSCGFGNADVCEGMFYPNFERFAAACYRKGVEDSADAVDESICACCYDENDQSIAEHIASEVRKLLEDTCTKI